MLNQEIKTMIERGDQNQENKTYVMVIQKEIGVVKAPMLNRSI